MLKLINPIHERESEMIRELRDKGFFDAFPTIENVVVTAKTKLQTDDNHNYIYYRDNFIRVIEKHKEKISSYLINHPGFKIIFFIFDESNTYIKLENGYSKRSLNSKREIAPGQLHIWWLDKAFLDVIINSEIDFVIWVTPYKQARVEGATKLNLPDVCIYDVKNIDLETITYIERRMVSNEA